jgi:hypothetical protein
MGIVLITSMIAATTVFAVIALGIFASAKIASPQEERMANESSLWGEATGTDDVSDDRAIAPANGEKYPVVRQTDRILEFAGPTSDRQ